MSDDYMDGIVPMMMALPCRLGEQSSDPRPTDRAEREANILSIQAPQSHPAEYSLWVLPMKGVLIVNRSVAGIWAVSSKSEIISR